MTVLYVALVFVGIPSFVFTEPIILRPGNIPFGSINLNIRGQYYYTRYQDPFRFATPDSSSFLKLPGLTFAINHAHPMVYQLRFQGSCVHFNKWSTIWLRFMIDDKILNSNHLFPNNDQRQSLAPNLGRNNDEMDARGGSVSVSGRSEFTHPCSKFETVYLPPGTHAIDVIARGGEEIQGGQLDVQLTHYDPTTEINLVYPTIH